MVVAEYRKIADNYIYDNFHVRMVNPTQGKFIVSPYFNLNNQVEIKTVTSEQNLRGHIYYDAIVVDSRYKIESPNFSQLCVLARMYKRVRDPTKTFTFMGDQS